MNTTRLLLTFLATALTASSLHATSVQVDLARFCGDCSRAGVQVKLDLKLGPGRFQITSHYGATDASGQITFDGVAPGDYRISIASVGAPLEITVPDSATTLLADALVTSPWTPPPQKRFYLPQFIGGTNAFQFVAPAGTVLKTDDGTNWYAATLSLSEGGGESVWTNNTELAPYEGFPVLLPLSVPDVLQITMNGSNQNEAVIFDTQAHWPTYWAGNGVYLVSVRTGGTNIFTVDRFGGIHIGQHLSDFVNDLGGTSDSDVFFRSIRNEAKGDGAHQEFVMLTFTDGQNTAEAHLETDSTYAQQTTWVTLTNVSRGIGQYVSGQVELLAEYGATHLFDLAPFATDGLYTFNSSAPRALTARLLSLQNFNTNVFTVAANGVVTSRAAGVSNVVMGGLYYFNTSAFTNLNAAGTMSNLANVSIAGNTLTNTGDSFRTEWEGQMRNAIENTNQFEIVFGSQTILDTGLLPASNCTFNAWCKVRRLSGTDSQRAYAHFEWGPGGGAPFAFTNASIDISQTNGIDTVLALKGGARVVGAHTNNSFQVSVQRASQ